MQSINLAPTFGGRRKSDEFHLAVNQIINTLRPMASLSVVSDHLNRAGLPTPSGLTWNRVRLNNYLRSSAMKIAAPSKS